MSAADLMLAWLATEAAPEPAEAFPLDALAERISQAIAHPVKPLYEGPKPAKAPEDYRPGAISRQDALAIPPPGEPIRMTREIAHLGAVNVHRNFDCPAYDACLAWVALRGWRGFSCSGCEGPRGG